MTSTYDSSQSFSANLVAIQDVETRLGISRPTLRRYMEELRIEAIKQGTKSYITAAQYGLLTTLKERMDEAIREGLNPTVAGVALEIRQHLGANLIDVTDIGETGGDEEVDRASDLVPRSEARRPALPPSLMKDDQMPQLLERSFPTFLKVGQGIVAPLAEAIHALGDKIAVALAPPLPRRIQTLQETYEFLDKAVSQPWPLQTSDLAAVLGMSPATLTSKPKVQRLGYVCVRVGKSGREALWKIEKMTFPSSHGIEEVDGEME